MADYSTSTMSIRDCRIHVMRGGSGSPMLFLHGGGGVGIWLPCMARLAKKFDVIVPEHPGFGASDTPDWLDNIQDLARFYLDFLDQLDLNNVDLVGSSLGGWIAAELAVRNTQRLNSLTLDRLGRHPCPGRAAGRHVPAQRRAAASADLFDDPKRIEAMIAEAKRPELEDVILKNRTTTAKLVWQPRSYDPHLHKWLHRIDVPTHLIWGANDKLFPQGLRLRVPEAHPGLGRHHHPRQRAPAACRAARGLRHRARRLPRKEEGRRMKFFNFHLMPYRHADLDAIEKNGSAWVTYLQPRLRSEEGRGALSRVSRPDGARRQARLRRRLPQRAPPDRLRHDADPRPARGRARRAASRRPRSRSSAALCRW